MKPKYGDNVKLCYTDTDSFVINVKAKDFYEDIANDVEKRFDASNYKVDRPLPTGKKKKKEIGLMKDELKEDEDEGRMIMTEFIAVRPKAYAYLMDDDSEVKKVKGIKKCVLKRVLKFSKYKNCLLNNEIVLKRQAKDMRYILKKSIRLH